MLSFDEWKKRAKNIQPKCEAFIGGEYVSAVSGETFDSINPADGSLLAKVASCSEEDVDKAVKVSRQSFELGEWRKLAPEERKKILLKFASLLSQNAEELALLETLDTGKPITESFTVDIPQSAECIAWFAECVDKIYDQVAPTDSLSLATITREPLGVVGAVIPWNFPLMMAAWKIGPALAMGNSVIVKPAEQSPLTAIRLGELGMEAGLPRGVLNIVPGLGEKAGRAIGLHPDIDSVTFTGSAEVGKLFMKYSGESNMKRISLECGGKSPQIVTANCSDIDEAASSVAWGIWYNQGEVCSAGSRLLVEESIKDEFLKKVMEWGPKIYPGDPLDPETKMGAIIDRAELDKIKDYIALGKKEGAKLLMGGRQVLAETEGYYVEPTVFDEVKNDMRIAREEIFGPVLCVMSFRTLDEAIKIANDSHYGLVASIWTKDISTAHRVAKQLRAGTVYVNCFDKNTLVVPFGGFKQSGFGRDNSLHALDKYCELKSTWVDLN